MDLKLIKGIGDKTEKLLNKINVFSVEDLINYIPKYYDIYKKTVDIKNINNNEINSILCKVINVPQIKKINKIIISAIAIDFKGTEINIKWFNMPYLKNIIFKDYVYVFRGKIEKKGNIYTMEHPQIFSEKEYEKKLTCMQPIYSLTKGLTNNMLAKYIEKGLLIVEQEDVLPLSIREKYNFPQYLQSIYDIHFPKNKELYIVARNRMVFEEFFMFMCKIRYLKNSKEKEKNDKLITDFSKGDSLIEKIPFELTKSQKEVIEDIKKNVSGKYVMNRLIQGDVGSGKTIVAVWALVCFADNGYQGAMMAPTEVLAKQHCDDIKNMFCKYHIDIKVELLCGSMTAKEKKEAKKRIENKEALIIIGTHALIQESVVFKKLGLVITDEQHRFGVKQRQTLEEKGSFVHTMVMSATPIPRTLAIFMYGDLDVSTINELPSNRIPIKNCVIGLDSRNKAYDFIRQEIQKGRQAYVVCPMVEESEGSNGENVIEYCKKLKSVLPNDINITYLHGKMKPKEKNEIMDRFSKNEIQVLVSTTVIEVGVNVPNATVMMIEDSQRFGLSSLHQLRGRVGRGEYQSYCIFINTNNSKTSKERLDVLKSSNDGFFIANEDLKLRGPGDIFGIRQSGEMLFKIGDIYNDSAILKQAWESANEFMENKIIMTNKEKEIINKELNKIILE